MSEKSLPQKPASPLAAPYRDRLDEQLAMRHRLVSLKKDLKPWLRGLEAAGKITEEETLPRFQHRVKDLNRRIKPIDLRRLRRSRRDLNRLMRITWFNPRAVKIRGVNFGIRLVFFAWRLFQFSLILLAAYLLIRLLWFLAP